MFERLVEYKTKFNSTSVLYRYVIDPQLGNWVVHPRIAYEGKIHPSKYKRNRRISIEEVDLLNSIGFIWYVYEDFWDRIYKRLIRYKDIHVNTLVPFAYHLDVPLGKWVGSQRKIYNKRELS